MIRSMASGGCVAPAIANRAVGVERALSAATAFVLIACYGPHYPAGNRGPLGDTLDSLRQSGLVATGCSEGVSGSFGAVRSCSGKLGDTLVFYNSDSQRRVVAIDRYWHIGDAQARFAADSVAAALSKAYGTARDCPTRDDSLYEWQLERRWQAPGGQVALWAGKPRPPLRRPAFIEVQRTAGPPLCGLWLSRLYRM